VNDDILNDRRDGVLGRGLAFEQGERRLHGRPPIEPQIVTRAAGSVGERRGIQHGADVALTLRQRRHPHRALVPQMVGWIGRSLGRAYRLGQQNEANQHPQSQANTSPQQ
jgi:hypothetical protein